jgi:hypothetical protein
MTPTQKQAVDQLKSEGFEIHPSASDMVLMSKGADVRFVRQDGSQKRADASNVKVIRGLV